MQFELYNAIQFYRELTTGHNTYFIFLTWLQIVIFLLCIYCLFVNDFWNKRFKNISTEGIISQKMYYS